MAKKYLLFETVSEWESANQQAENELGIPSGNTLRYADRHTVNNPAHVDYGKHIFPVTDNVSHIFTDTIEIDEWLIDNT